MAEETGENISQTDENNSEESTGDKQSEENEHFSDEFEGSVPHEEEERQFSYFDALDAPKDLPEPLEITLEHLKDICCELGIIKLCWPDIIHPVFEDRTNFPSSYTKLNNKEKVLLLYAENFRQQYCHRHPNRKPLLLACENECGMQKMVCTTLRPSVLPYPELETWKDCAVFVADHIKYEALEDFPTLIMSRKHGSGHYNISAGLPQGMLIFFAFTLLRGI